MSLPCWEAFFDRSGLSGCGARCRRPRVSIEAAATFGWERIVGDRGLKIGIDRFGASAPDTVLAEKLGFTAEAIADRVREFLGT